MGTGNLHYPRDVVAETMFNTVIAFSKANPSSGLTDVRFVLYNKDQQTITVGMNYSFLLEDCELQSCTNISKRILNYLQAFENYIADLPRIYDPSSPSTSLRENVGGRQRSLDWQEGMSSLLRVI